MKLTRLARTSGLLAILLLATRGVTPAATISNQAVGTVSGVALDPARANVSLFRIDSIAASAVAEIAPNDVLANTTANAFAYDVLPTIGVGDSGVQSIDVTIPAGYANLVTTGVSVAGSPLVANCPVPSAGEYCATVSGSVLTVLLGTKVTTTSVIRIQFVSDGPPSAGSADFTSTLRDGVLFLDATPGNADGDAADANSVTVLATDTQGLVLDIRKAANKPVALVGEVVTYGIEIRNLTNQDVVQVRVEDLVPPGFKYLRGTARIDGAPMPDPSGNRLLVFDVGTVPGFVDQNANGRVDPGEPGYRLLTYQLVIGSGVRPGAYPNTAVSKDFCDLCRISNESAASVEVRLDPVFDLGTILGKVFEDRNRNGVQEPDEPGIANAFVALDDGTYALTDELGRYHFPAVKPGHRMVKIDLNRLPAGATTSTGDSHVVWVTPGLMLTADFGVCLTSEVESLGTASTPAVAVASEHSNPPIEVQGSAEALSLLVNGSQVPLPLSDARLTLAAIPESIRVRGSAFEKPARFELGADRPAEVAEWSLSIHGGGGEIVKTFEGKGAPPASVSWDGKRDDGTVVAPGDAYAYQLEVRYADGARTASARRLLGIGRTNITALNLLGDAFETGRSVLSPKARKILDDAARTLKQHPHEKIVIEGHTDWVGTNAYNMELSRARAQAAFDYLVSVRKLPAEQFILAWYGEERPMAPNETPEGRMLNRRVVIQGQVQEDRGERLDQYRASPEVRINGESVSVGDRGRFFAPVDGNPSQVEVAVTDTHGRSTSVSVRVPSLTLTAPDGEHLVPYGSAANGCTASAPTAAGAWPPDRPAVVCRLAGRTDPGNQVEVDGRSVSADVEGAFAVDLPLRLGDNSTSVVVRNGEGLTRLADVSTQVADHDADGRLLVASTGAPTLTVQLPPKGLKLKNPNLEVSGTTDPGSELTINGKHVEVQADGTFRETVVLSRGPSRLVIAVKDPQGRTGSIERDVEVAKHEIFLLAFAEGMAGELRGKGYIEGAGLDEKDDFYTTGRVAYYLKGTIAGKYLITSAFDSAKDSRDTLFGDLNGEESQRLLTNLDPDKYYPVYGDDSSVVWDVESRGKFYLAVDSDTIHAVVGNYPLSLSETELAAYRRTLYGARFAYQSVSRSPYGDADTQVVLFGAELEQEHVHDEIRATGGALYYLSRRDVIEGSEEITIVVRDKVTGLQLSATRQSPNVDYVVKYDEGRVMFERPISSVVAGGSLVDASLLSGNAVFILVDYESRVDSFEKTAYGGRVRQQIGDHVAVGVTYVQDEPQSGSYELQGADAELRLGKNTRIVAETAKASGSDSVTNLSEDGGLTYTEVASSGTSEGTAWKAAADLDVGEWFGTPDRYRVRAYYKDLEPGFSSSGNFQEQGTRKMGLEASLDVTEADSVRIREDREERTGGGPFFAGSALRALDTVLPPVTLVTETTNRAVQWIHTKLRWGFAVEYFDTETTNTSQLDRSYAAGHFWSKLGEKLTARFEQQQTLSGPDNNQTTAGLELQVLPNLALEVKGTTGSLGQSAQAGVVYTVGESTVYLSERIAEDQAGEATTTVLGAKSPIGKDTKVYTEYQWEDAATGGRTISLVGLQRQWVPTPGLRILLSAENADAKASAGDTSRTAVSAGLAYANQDGFSAQTRQEMRWEDGAASKRQYFTVNQIDYRLNADLTALARLRYGKTENEDLGTVDARLDERVLGLAYRPVHHTRFNALFKYTSLLDQRPLNVASSVRSSRKMEVFSVDTSFRISPRIEWLAKEAARVMNEQVESLPSVRTSTYLVIQRLNFKIWRPIGVAVEYRVMGQREADDQRQGWLTEAMWEFMRNVSAGVGYNFTDFSDNLFSGNDYQVEGWYFRVQAKY